MTSHLLDISEADYHADKIGKEPTLSASIAHIGTSQSWAHAFMAHPRLGGRASEATDATDRGSLIHQLVLESDALIHMVDADSWRTKAAKESRDAARADGFVPVLSHKYEAAKVDAQRLKERIAELNIDLSGAAVEQTIAWSDGPVACRSRLDLLWLDEGRIIDLKTCASAHPDACAASMVRYGYAIQDCAYRRAVEALRPDLEGRVTMTFLFCETEPPYAVTAIEPAGTMREFGESRWLRALSGWATCLETGHWPAYAEAVIRAEAPAWALARELEEGYA